jgi:hypothetical protein
LALSAMGGEPGQETIAHVADPALCDRCRAV